MKTTFTLLASLASPLVDKVRAALITDINRSVNAGLEGCLDECIQEGFELANDANDLEEVRGLVREALMERVMDYGHEWAMYLDTYYSETAARGTAADNIAACIEILDDADMLYLLEDMTSKEMRYGHEDALTAANWLVNFTAEVVATSWNVIELSEDVESMMEEGVDKYDRRTK